MARIRSPGYPSINLQEAIVLVRKIHESNRRNPTDREAAAKDMGFSGLTGQSSKMLADLAHFGLIERAGKGGLRVTEVAERILHPRNEREKAEALLEAAYTPGLFASIKDGWPDGFVSENNLKAFLAREGFAPSAIQPALKAYQETYGILQQSRAAESQDALAVSERESSPELTTRNLARRGEWSEAPPVVYEPAPSRSGVQLMAGERIVFVEENRPDQYLKLIASGEMDTDLLEALEDYVKRQKKRLSRTGSDVTPSHGA